jgi:hypothetical protein
MSCYRFYFDKKPKSCGQGGCENNFGIKVAAEAVANTLEGLGLDREEAYNDAINKACSYEGNENLSANDDIQIAVQGLVNDLFSDIIGESPDERAKFLANLKLVNEGNLKIENAIRDTDNYLNQALEDNDKKRDYDQASEKEKSDIIYDGVMSGNFKKSQNFKDTREEERKLKNALRNFKRGPTPPPKRKS